MSASESPLRWGFLGCGKIANDFANAMKNVPSAVPWACAARALTTAQDFAQLHGFDRAYGSYEALVSDAGVDVVYISTIHTSHYEHSLVALQHGKHVLVEKPMAMNAKEATKVIALANEKGVFFLEGMWTRFFPAVKHVRDLITQGDIGDIHHVSASIGYPFPPDYERMWDVKLGGGGLLDIGIYPLAFVTMALGYKPEKISAVGGLSSGGVDAYGSVTLQFGGNRFGTIQYSCLALLHETVVILGSKGRILIEPFAHVPTKVATFLYAADGSTTTSHSEFPIVQPHRDSTPFSFGEPMAGFLYEIEAVGRAIHGKTTCLNEYPHDESLAIATIMDEIRAQLGVVYAADTRNFT